MLSSLFILSLSLSLCTSNQFRNDTDGECSTFAESLNFEAFKPRNADHISPHKCTQFFRERYDTSNSYSWSDKQSISLLNVKVNSCLHNRVPAVVRLKLVDLRSARPLTSSQHRRNSFAYQIEVGYLANRFIEKFCRQCFPSKRSDQISTYVGMERLVDFGYCSADAAHLKQGKSPISGKMIAWLSMDKFRWSRSGLVDQLYLVTSDAESLTLETQLSDFSFFLKDEKISFNRLRSVFIQIFSTLYYASSVSFTHWHLLTRSIIAVKQPRTSSRRYWYFHIMPIDRNCLLEPKYTRKGLFDNLSGIENSHRVNIRSRHSLKDLDLSMSGRDLPSSDSIYQEYANQTILSRAHEEEVKLEKELCAKLETPLFLFRVPVAATGEYLYKISDFSRSRISDDNGAIYATYTANYDPMIDLHRLGVDILRVADFEIYYQHLKSNQDAQGIIDFKSVSSLLMKMISWTKLTEQEEEYFDYCISFDLRRNLTTSTLSDSKIVRKISSAMKLEKSETYLFFKYLMKKRAELRFSYSDSQVMNFRQRILHLMKHDFFKKFIRKFEDMN